MGTGPNLPLRAIAAAESAGRELAIAGFDLSPDLIGAIDDGTSRSPSTSSSTCRATCRWC